MPHQTGRDGVSRSNSRDPRSGLRPQIGIAGKGHTLMEVGRFESS
jgi:hypothetical protein